jgi:hypothetical protein
MCLNKRGEGRISSFLSWVESILRSTVSRPVPFGIGLPFRAHDQILSLSWQLLCCSSCRAPSLTRGRVCNLQCNHWGPITIHYCLIWDCVPSSSPLTTRRDYGEGILTRLHTGLSFLDREITWLASRSSFLSRWTFRYRADANVIYIYMFQDFTVPHRQINSHDSKYTNTSAEWKRRNCVTSSLRSTFPWKVAQGSSTG